MVVDRYTKAVLTVIAVCLLWLSMGGPSLITPVRAQSDRDRVYIAGWIDEQGAIRPLPIVDGTGKVASGKFAPSAPLPMWQANR